MFTQQYTTNAKLNVPFHDAPEALVQRHLQEDFFLSTMWHTIIHKLTNTHNGQVAVWFVSVTSGSTQYDLVLGHFCLWRNVMAQIFSGWGSNCTLDRMKAALEPFIVDGWNVDDMGELRKFTGTKVVAKKNTFRRKSAGIFAVSAQWFRHAYHILAPIFTVQDLEQNLCTPKRFSQLTSHLLGNERQIMPHSLLDRPQSKASVAAYFEPMDTNFTATTPGFGMEWDSAMLQQLEAVQSFLLLPRGHMISLTQPTPTHPQQTRKAIKKQGVPVDHVRHQETYRNLTRKRHQRTLAAAGLKLPRGRRTEKTRIKAAKAEIMLRNLKQQERVFRESPILKREAATVPNTSVTIQVGRSPYGPATSLILSTPYPAPAPPPFMSSVSDHKLLLTPSLLKTPSCPMIITDQFQNNAPPANINMGESLSSASSRVNTTGVQRPF